jgi:prepilin-type N-terminal cleavage/methylation domain-containing protein
MIPAARGSRGFTLVEVMVACAILALGMVGVLAAIAAGDAEDESSRGRSIAIDAARREAEKIASTPFSQVFAAYNGASGAAWFSVAGLTPVAGDAQVGEVLFPVVAGAPGTLREDTDDASVWHLRFPMSDPRTALLGMPRDLDGDGVIDSNGKQGSYKVLPVLVTLRWKTMGGVEDSLALRLLLTDRSGGS